MASLVLCRASREGPGLGWGLCMSYTAHQAAQAYAHMLRSDPSMPLVAVKVSFCCLAGLTNTAAPVTDTTWL